MRRLNWGVLVLAFVAGAGTFYLYEKLDDLLAHRCLSSEDTVSPTSQESDKTPEKESDPVENVATTEAPERETISDSKNVNISNKKPERTTTAPAPAKAKPSKKQTEVTVQEDKKTPRAQEKPTAKTTSNEKVTSKTDTSHAQKGQKGMKTLPVEDNFRLKEHKTPGTLGYKHWTGWYYPTKFILTINDTPIITFDGHQFTRPTKELTFDQSKPLKAHFVWEFLNGRKAGWRSTDFKLSPEAKSIFVGFDWKDEWQVIIDQAEPIPESDRESDNKNVAKK